MITKGTLQIIKQFSSKSTKKKFDWNKSAFKKHFPTYTKKDLALDVGALSVGVGIGAAIRSNKKKKET